MYSWSIQYYYYYLQYSIPRGRSTTKREERSTDIHLRSRGEEEQIAEPIAFRFATLLCVLLVIYLIRIAIAPRNRKTCITSFSSATYPRLQTRAPISRVVLRRFSFPVKALSHLLLGVTFISSCDYHEYLAFVFSSPLVFVLRESNLYVL